MLRVFFIELGIINQGFCALHIFYVSSIYKNRAPYYSYNSDRSNNFCVTHKIIYRILSRILSRIIDRVK